MVTPESLGESIEQSYLDGLWAGGVDALRREVVALTAALDVAIAADSPSEGYILSMLLEVDTMLAEALSVESRV